MNYKRGLGIGLICVGLFIMLTGRTITGAVIGFQPQNYLSILGVLVFIVGVFLITTTAIAEKVKEKAGRASELEESIKVAVEQEVPLKEARKIFNKANKKVESGEWVQLAAIAVKSTTDPEMFPQATSLCRYWGPEQYEGVSNRELIRLYDAGKIGKTHEMLRGSAKYKLGGSLFKGTVSMPPAGSRALHRHWEIAQMYERKKEKESPEFKKLKEAVKSR